MTNVKSVKNNAFKMKTNLKAGHRPHNAGNPEKGVDPDSNKKGVDPDML